MTPRILGHGTHFPDVLAQVSGCMLRFGVPSSLCMQLWSRVLGLGCGTLVRFHPHVSPGSDGLWAVLL